MSDQIQSNPEATLDKKTEEYIRGRIALRGHDFGTNEETTQAFVGQIVSTMSITLDDDCNPVYDGIAKTSSLDKQIMKLREIRPELFPRFGQKKEPEASEKAPEVKAPKPAQPAPGQSPVPAKNLIVYEGDVSSSSWMRANGMKFLPSGKTLFDALGSGEVKVTKKVGDATLDVGRDLSVDLNPKNKELPATVVPRGMENNRLFLRKIEQKYASIGGYFEAVRRGLVTFEK